MPYGDHNKKVNITWADGHVGDVKVTNPINCYMCSDVCCALEVLPMERYVQ